MEIQTPLIRKIEGKGVIQCFSLIRKRKNCGLRLSEKTRATYSRTDQRCKLTPIFVVSKTIRPRRFQ